MSLSGRRQRIPWFAIFLGLILGVMAGLGYAWYFNPVTFVNIGPARLYPEDQQDYVLLVGEAYLYDNDIARAHARLEALGVRDVPGLVTGQADQALLSGDDPEQVRALTALAEALGGAPMAAEIFSGTVAPTSPVVTVTITPTFAGMPTLTPSPAQPTPTWTPFVPTLTPTRSVIAGGVDLIALNTICDDDYPEGLIEIWVRDADGDGIPGVKIVVDWAGGVDTFFTGMKPEINDGYADFEMEPDKLYTVTLAGLSEPVMGISSAVCYTGSGQESIPTYQLVFAPVEDE